jgi:lipopolysaccharide/colanic/teichoic acid biosynthesis glycosyltransferase
MTSLAQTSEDFGSGLVAQWPYQALALLARVVLGVALLPVVLLVACLVARDTGVPLITWVRLDNGTSSPSPKTVRFRTNRIDTQSGTHRRIARSKIGNFLCRTGLDKLPNLYFGSINV